MEKIRKLSLILIYFYGLVVFCNIIFKFPNLASIFYGPRWNIIISYGTFHFIASILTTYLKTVEALRLALNILLIIPGFVLSYVMYPVLCEILHDVSSILDIYSMYMRISHYAPY